MYIHFYETRIKGTTLLIHTKDAPKDINGNKRVYVVPFIKKDSDSFAAPIHLEFKKGSAIKKVVGGYIVQMANYSNFNNMLEFISAEILERL